MISVLNKIKLGLFFRFHFWRCSECYMKDVLTSYVVLSLLSASLLSSGPDTIFRSPDLLITAVIWEISTDKPRVRRVRRYYTISTTTIEILQLLTPKAKTEIRQSPPTTVQLILMHSQSTPSPDEDHGSIVQRVDNFIQWINRYPTDKMYSNYYILSAR